MTHRKHHDDGDDNGLAVKIGTAALSFAAGWAAQKLVKVAWKQITGTDAPTDLEDPEVALVSAVAFAAVGAGVGVLAQRLATRQGKRMVTAMVHHQSVAHHRSA